MSMDPPVPPASPAAPVVEWVIGDDVIAGIAMHAASATPGVVRVEPGLRGLVGSFRRAARPYTRTAEPAQTGGVSVEVAGGTTWIGVNIVSSGQDQAAAIAQAVQRAVARDVTRDTGLDVAEVRVSIVDIDLSGERR
ncbi:MAG: Asp23/Gls24 family envelope stress response protein [Haloechinothrix sp.]